jgi:hypothetical protein
MPLTLQADTLYAPPADRDYQLELLEVPDGVTGAPAVGTIWDLPLDSLYTIDLPTYQTANGLEGYKFSFTIGEVVPEPGTLSLLAIGALWVAFASRRRAE